MYDKTVCLVNDRQEIGKHYSGRYGAPGMPREKRRRQTPEDMVRVNRWKKRRELRRLIELNFRGGDYHIVLTCRREERPTGEEIKKVWASFQGKMRRAYTAQGWEWKWIVSCRVGERGAIHWHLICNNMHSDQTDTAKLIRKNWIRGRPYISVLDDTGDYSRLADYLIRETEKHVQIGDKPERLSYSRSRNLIKPVIRTEKVRASSWRKIPSIPKGWHLVPGTLYNGRNRFNGLPYQYYTIAKGALTRQQMEERYGADMVDKTANDILAGKSPYMPPDIGEEVNWADADG